MKMSWCKLRVLRRYFSSTQRQAIPSSPRLNDINIQLLSEAVHQQIFRTTTLGQQKDVSGELSNSHTGQDAGTIHTGQEGFAKHVKTLEDKYVKKVERHLKDHGLWGLQTKVEENVDLQIPEVIGNNIDEHFHALASQQIRDYVMMAERLMKQQIPGKPKIWQYTPGWTRYNSDGTTTTVDQPEDNILVFDVETVVTEGSYPAMATAVSDTHWYSWASEYVVLDKFRWSQGLEMKDLIPLENRSGSHGSGQDEPRLVIGHNVSFDRSFVREQYHIQKSRLRFVDTMSLHIAVCGLTNFQRILYKADQNNSNQKAVKEFRERQRIRGTILNEDWKDCSTLNNLQDVHMLHVGGQPISKDPRKIFEEGTTEDVRKNFQDLMTYCANDVVATYQVFQALWPQFTERFPHPVTLAGMFEMGTGYLPVNDNWERYVHQSNTVFEDMQQESKQLLMKLANDACTLLSDHRYEDDPWLWDLDWSVSKLKIKAPKPPPKPRKNKKSQAVVGEAAKDDVTVGGELEKADDIVAEVLSHQERHYKTTGDLLNYPKWYRQLCPRSTSEDWSPGLSNISYQTRVTPKLLRLTWDGYILHFDDTHGWGYLVPGRTDNLHSTESRFPYKQLCKVMNLTPDNFDEDPSDDAVDDSEMTDEQFEATMAARLSYDDLPISEVRRYLDQNDVSSGKRKKKVVTKKGKHLPVHVGDGPHDSVNIPGCWFYKIPHKDGAGKRVGNPLAKDYQNRVEDGTLRALSGSAAERVLKLNKASSYWKNNQKRIEAQMKVWLNEDHLPDTVKQDPQYIEGSHIGAIVPRVVSAGTITRRAVEPTWLTASNAYVDRIGSELKSMVQSPPGYCFVGADVDSQELWIGAILGDAHFGKTHGCTALGWMALQGNKKEKTDLHSKVAETVDISRDHAKVLNYGRIYGAGQPFAEKLLMQFNHRMTNDEAKKKAQLMFRTTKGIKSRDTGKWHGGSESAMFNKLEEIACQQQPSTPVLGCRISKALEPENVSDGFMTSRINWVVQSSAVDYLHLMLVCMRWLFDKYDIQGRFCISIHDEVRYLVSREDSHRAALALQITNLLTRSMFAYKLGMQDLPQSVAFFSAVDIDTCLRKEVDINCETPSNPHGLESGYQILPGEALDIHQILDLTGGTLEKKHQPVGSSSRTDPLQAQV